MIGYVIRHNPSDMYYGVDTYWSNIDQAKVYKTTSNAEKAFVFRKIDKANISDYSIVKIERITVVKE